MRLIDAEKLIPDVYLAKRGDYAISLNQITFAPTVEFPEQITIKSDTEEDEQKLLLALRNAKLKVLIEEERPQGEWIPVSERLPDLFEVVLVTDKTGKVFEYERRPLDEEGNVCEEWAFLGRKIIAWMPLPEPYKEDEEK